MMKLSKAFTLLETLIVITILGVLSLSLIQSYRMITEISFSIEQEKNLNEESLILLQTLQTISEQSTIDYSFYTGENEISSTNGYSSLLALTGGEYMGAKIYTTGTCLSGGKDLFSNSSEDSDNLGVYSGCELVLEQNGIITPLLLTHKLFISEATFRIIPYRSNEDLFNTNNTPHDIYNYLGSPSFTLFISFYSPFFKNQHQQMIVLPLQLFFNTNVYL